MIPHPWIEEASQRLSGTIVNTPMTYDAALDIFIKWETVQVTGSFKVRGALNRLLSMAPWELQQGVVCASAGNHGLGVAFACQQTQTLASVFVPENSSPVKIEGIRSLGAEVSMISGGYAKAEHAAKNFAAAQGRTWISPYNDGQIIAGQGTIAYEILVDYPDASDYTWIAPIGGGGLISGTAACLRAASSRPAIIGVQVEASPFFYSLYHFGHQKNIIEHETLAEGLAGAIEQNSMTIPIVRKSVQDIVLVSELELVQAIAYAWENYGEPMEPSGAAGLAAVLSGKVSAKPAVVIVSGGNITPADHLDLVQRSVLISQGV